MPTFELNFEVFCANCSNGLCNQTTTKDAIRGRGQKAHVEPCEKCLGAARDEGREKGLEEGKEMIDVQSEKEYNRGFEAGRKEGYLEGYEQALRTVKGVIV